MEIFLHESTSVKIAICLLPSFPFSDLFALIFLQTSFFYPSLLYSRQLALIVTILLFYLFLSQPSSSSHQSLMNFVLSRIFNMKSPIPA